MSVGWTVLVHSESVIGGLVHNRHCFLIVLEAEKPKSKVLGDLVSDS